MSIEGTPVGAKAIDKIVGTNELRFQSGLAIALELLPLIRQVRWSSMPNGSLLASSASSMAWAQLNRGKRRIMPIWPPRGQRLVDCNRRLQTALSSPGAMNISQRTAILTAGSVHNHLLQAISAEAIKIIMKDNHVLNLPVEIDGKVAYSVTRRDLLWARIGLR